MANGMIISTVGKELVRVLTQYGGFAQGEIALKSPADAAQGLKLSMFLYQIEQNPHLRNQEMIQQDGALQAPPLPLDLYYLVTALEQEPDAALGHLEDAMVAFHEHPVLRAPDLSQTLLDAGNEEIRIVPYPLSLENINQLWGIFPNKSYQLSVAYLVTPVEVPTSRTVPITRVVERMAKFYHMGEKG